jgi:hypothetical protein
VPLKSLQSGDIDRILAAAEALEAQAPEADEPADQAAAAGLFS